MKNMTQIEFYKLLNSNKETIEQYLHDKSLSSYQRIQLIQKYNELNQNDQSNGGELEVHSNFTQSQWDDFVNQYGTEMEGYGYELTKLKGAFLARKGSVNKYVNNILRKQNELVQIIKNETGSQIDINSVNMTSRFVNMLTNYTITSGGQTYEFIENRLINKPTGNNTNIQSEAAKVNSDGENQSNTESQDRKNNNKEDERNYTAHLLISR